MAIIPTSSTIPLTDLISKLRSGQIRINRMYQRSGGIWPPRAKSFLVETVLLKMPIPRVLLHDIAPPHASHEADIIDGQQRCTILRQFREGGFALTGAVEYSVFEGKRFVDLTPRHREAFNSYLVPIDRYSGIAPRKIREVFRRLNYYTAPLNAAEQRHAQFAGELSRFVERQSRAWNGTFRQIRTFTKRQLRRKADEQLMAEVIAAMLGGMSTPTATSLRTVYGKYDHAFSSGSDFKRRLKRARLTMGGWKDLRTNSLSRKHYQVSSLLLALMHAQGDLASLRRDLGTPKPLRSEDRIIAELSRMEDAINRKVTKGFYGEFSAASESKTNVRENRLTRCKYFYRALTGQFPKSK